MTRAARIGFAAVLLLGGATMAMAQNGPPTGGYPPARWNPNLYGQYGYYPRYYGYILTTRLWLATGTITALPGRGGAMTRSQRVEYRSRRGLGCRRVGALPHGLAPSRCPLSATGRDCSTFRLFEWHTRGRVDAGAHEAMKTLQARPS